MNLLVSMAILPIIALCSFIYFKDKNREPHGLLALIFGLGAVSVLPVVVGELVFDAFFPLDSIPGVIPVFIQVFFGVALFEEGFKWLITKFLGYENKAFDEVYDVIVYSVFASLGFACVENILYVLQNGFGNAIMRALLAIPGHTCFAISMGYYLSKAKVGQINGNHNIYVKNTLLSVIVPMILHTCYDALLMIIPDVSTMAEMLVEMLPFLSFYLVMVIACFLTVDKTAKVQQNLSTNLNNGNIVRNSQGVLYYNYQNQPVSHVSSTVTPAVTPTVRSIASNNVTNQSNPVSVSQPVITQVMGVPQSDVSAEPRELLFCPICGKSAKGLNYCGRCGFKLK